MQLDKKGGGLHTGRYCGQINDIVIGGLLNLQRTEFIFWNVEKRNVCCCDYDVRRESMKYNEASGGGRMFFVDIWLKNVGVPWRHFCGVMKSGSRSR
jgi:hypothetical protein